ncbi:MAG: O-antigen ligase family protein [Rhabdochlamydiaceae bacterium]|nr:O-antigen ligase family protein [Rhabdochlamydiaceae bacterium]
MTTTRLFDRLLHCLFLAIFLLFPFQKKHKLCRLYPSDNIDLPHSFSTAVYYYFTDILILAFIALCLYRYRRQLMDFFFFGPAKYLTSLIMIALLSLSQSIMPGYCLHYVRLFQFSIPIFFFLAAIMYVRKKQITHVFWIIYATAMVQCVIAIAQYFTQDSLNLHAFGEVNNDFFRFRMITGERWLFDTLFGISTGTNYLLRACGTFDHPNVFGGFIFFSLIITYVLYLQSSKILSQRVLLISIFFLFFSLCVSFSRAALFAAVISTGLCAGLSLYRYFFVSKDVQILKVFKLCSTAALSVTLCLALLYAPFFERGGVINYNQLVQSADGERVAYQKMACEMAKDSLLLGVGFNQFQIYSQQHAHPAHLFSKVHNIYLLLLAELGICGLASFLLFAFALVKTAAKAPWDERGIALFSLFIGLLFIGGCDFYFLEGHKPRIFFWAGAFLLYISTAPKQKQIEVLAS